MRPNVLYCFDTRLIIVLFGNIDSFHTYFIIESVSNLKSYKKKLGPRKCFCINKSDDTYCLV